MTVGRPLEFDPDQALEQAMDVFWSKGYESTSLRDLLSAMELSKSSFYAAFGSKSELFDRCVSHYADELAAEMKEASDRAPSARQFVEDMFLAMAAEAGSPPSARGCLFWNTVTEFGQRDPRVRRIVAQGVERFAGVFARAIRRGQADGEIDRRKDPEVLGLYLLSSMGGVRALLKSGVDEERSREVVETILHTLG